MRVLVVDDDAELLRAICDALRDEGIDAVAAENAERGGAAIRDGAPFDVIVLDVAMRRRMAPEALADVPVIVMATSAATAPSGCTLIRKPFGMDTLVGALERLSGVWAVAR